MFGISKALKSVDMYGHPINVNYRGENSYKTSYGGLLSLLTYFLTIIMVVRATEELVLMKDPSVKVDQKPLSYADREELAPMNVADYDNFIFVLGVEIKDRIQKNDGK